MKYKSILLSSLLLSGYVTANTQSAQDYLNAANAQYELTSYSVPYNQSTLVQENLQKAIELLEKAAYQDDANAQNQLGEWYENGIGMDQNKEKALYWYKKAATNGNASAQNHLGLLENSREWFEKASKQGYAKASYNLAILEEYGDQAQYKKWLEKAIQQNHPEAEYTLIGRNLIQASPQKRAEIMQKSALNGNVFAQYSLASAYQTGDGIQKDLKQAFKWYQVAAENGIGFYGTKAKYELGLLYYYGQGTERNSAQSVYWLEQAMNEGFYEAHEKLAQFVKEGLAISNMEKNALIARLNVQEKQSQQAQALYEKGAAYYDGNNVPQDYAKAFPLIQESANKGNSNAQYTLGYMYLNGNGVSKDLNHAFYWFKKSADQNNHWALEEVGELYEKGISVKRNLNLAKQYYAASCDPEEYDYLEGTSPCAHLVRLTQELVGD